MFRESHRRHLEPNCAYETQVIPRTESKPLYCYSDSLESLGDPANKEYYLASIFTHIHLQNKGALNLWGLLSQQFFLRDFMLKYGIDLHVVKHGEYKNAPDMFTERSFQRSHHQATTSLLDAINVSVCHEIARSRSEGLLTSWLQKNLRYNPKRDRDLWKSIHEAGTFPALTAWKAGLVDYIPRRDPLPDLLERNTLKEEEKKEALVKEWDVQETDFERFQATDAVSLQDYAKQKRKERATKARRNEWHVHAQKYPAVASMLSSVGILEGDDKSKGSSEKVALLFTQGESGIGAMVARKLVHDIRKVRKDKDVKAVVLRVTSPGGAITPCETIRQELAALKVPLIVSFGNVSASGGYYISAGADRIFASDKTITGSIGVFGIRADMTKLAKQYGVNVEHVATGDLAGTYSPFYPMSRKMKKLMGERIDRSYLHFKEIVGDGRKLTDVESLAKGRVWTGTQAKDNGLVDEIGGLHRALAYAKRNCTASGDEAEVVVWPKKESLFTKVMEATSQKDARFLWTTMQQWACGAEFLVEEEDSRQESLVDWVLRTSSSRGLPGSMSNVMLTVDENAAIRCALSELGDSPMPGESFPPSFWE